MPGYKKDSKYGGRQIRVHKRCGGRLKTRKLTEGWTCKKCNTMIQQEQTEIIVRKKIRKEYERVWK